MSNKIEFKDADGKDIEIGSVLLNIYDKKRGVVIDLVDEKCKWIRYAAISPCFGDMRIKLGSGSYRVTNICSEWRHIHRDEQTYRERYESWVVRPHVYDDSKPVDKNTDLLISGICNILPQKYLDGYENMDIIEIEEVLSELVDYLESRS